MYGYEGLPYARPGEIAAGDPSRWRAELKAVATRVRRAGEARGAHVVEIQAEIAAAAEAEGALAWRRVRTWWCLNDQPRLAQRLWRVVARPKVRKVSLTIAGPVLGGPRYRLRVFEPGTAAMFPRLEDGAVEGPIFRLTFADAEALFRDRDVRITPWIEKIVLYSGAEPEPAAPAA